jgi:hypothetical protein
MDVMHDRVAGLDVHKAMIVACVRLVSGSKVSRECQTFESTTAGAAVLAGVADGFGLHAWRNGSDRGLLKAGVEYPERGRVRTDSGQCRPHQDCSRPQDRRQ